MVYDHDDWYLALAALQRPTDPTRAHEMFGKWTLSQPASGVLQEEMTAGLMVQMSHGTHSMAAAQGFQHGFPFACHRGRSLAPGPGQWADVPAAWGVPYLWMCFPAAPVSLGLLDMRRVHQLIDRVGPISLLDNFSIFDWKSMHPSMAARPMGAFQIPISPSA